MRGAPERCSTPAEFYSQLLDQIGTDALAYFAHLSMHKLNLLSLLSMTKAYPRGTPFRFSTQVGSGLACKHRTRLERIARDTCSN